MRKKSNIIDKGNYIIENKEKLLHKRKKRKKIRGLILLVIIMVTTLVTLCMKLPYFDIKNIEIIGNVNASKTEINDIAKTHLGSNILYDSFSDTSKQIMGNPYVLSVEVKKAFPSKIIIEINEKRAMFYGKANNNFYIIDNKGNLLQKKSDIKGMNLVNLIGFNYENAQVGSLIGEKSDRKIDTLVSMASIIENYRKTSKSNKIMTLDVKNVLDIKILYGNMYIKFGTTLDLKNKFNKAINIITQPQYENAKGYVDVSFTGNPAIYVEHKK
ncbi:FtsQ-type POTRA domain-containing protein [Clostridium estertheticum]|uniref:cell division protein FtsQ/DivIB n=1 Tax=Clostridium estertheticum TaxID=238834 RepID=UPI001C7D7EED|nr:FtsQ-type POTRA domain-containing protein [Clostridium estertheticum]MBX4259171.1 FtsQ-type POTRA domain-containing protein [Clostridium estertheticum]WLC68856.1 FtsQ-type POTRA domain-containing protein [Clostridium estertheticum]